MEQFKQGMILLRGSLLGFICFFLLSNAYAQIAFGTAHIHSSIGQPLNATINVEISPQDFETLRGRTYRKQANAAKDSTITTRISKGPRGAVVRLGSLSPINDPFINVVVELITDSGSSILAPFTFFIDPPNKQTITQNNNDQLNHQYTESLSRSPNISPFKPVSVSITSNTSTKKVRKKRKPVVKRKVRHKTTKKTINKKKPIDPKREIAAIDQKITAARKKLELLEALVLTTQQELLATDVEKLLGASQKNTEARQTDQKISAEKAAAERLAAEGAAVERLAAEKAAAEKLAAEKAAAERLAAEKAAAERLAAERAAAERLAAEKAAAEKLAAEKAAAERLAAEKAAAERLAAERAAAERLAAERAAAERLAAEKAAAEKLAAERAAAERLAAEKAAAEKLAAERTAAERLAAERAAEKQMLQKKQSSQAPVTSQPQEEEGLFGIAWLPNPSNWIDMSSLDGLFTFDSFDSFFAFFTPEILWAIGGLLIFLAIVFLFLSWRKRRIVSKKKNYDYDYDIKNLDGFNPLSQENESMFSSAKQEADTETSVPKPAEEKKKRKKSFLNKLKKESDEEKKESEVIPTVDFSELEGEEKKQKASASTKIESNDKEDFLKDLEKLNPPPPLSSPAFVAAAVPAMATPVAPAELPDVIENDNHTRTILTPSPTDQTSEVSFSDEITRIDQTSEDHQDPVSTAMLEMFSEEETPTLAAVQPIPEKESYETPASEAPISENDLPEEASMDELDFSAEKTMVMPSLKDVVYATDEELNAPSDTFDFKLDVGNRSSHSEQNTAVPNIIEDDMTNVPPDSSQNNPVETSSGQSFDVPDFSLPSLDDTSSPPSVPDVSQTPDATPHEPQATKSDPEDDTKASDKKTESTTGKPPVMIDLAALDLSSLKLD